jgi:hypothetical protein
MKPVQNISRAWVIRLVRHNPAFKDAKPEYFRGPTRTLDGYLNRSWDKDPSSAVKFTSEAEAKEAMKGKFWVDVEAIEMTVHDRED